MRSAADVGLVLFAFRTARLLVLPCVLLLGIGLLSPGSALAKTRAAQGWELARFPRALNVARMSR